MAKARAVKRNLTLSPDEAAQARRSPHLLPTTDAERAAPLRSYTPRFGPPPTADLREVLISLVTATPFKTAKRDLDLMAALADLAGYDANVNGSFDPHRALAEATLTAWCKTVLQARGVSARSQGDYLSRVRDVARFNNLLPFRSTREAKPRGVASPPADKRAWARALDNAQRLPADLCTDVTMVADLTFGAGMRADEVARARRDDLYLLANGEARITVTNHHGVIREVPIGPYPTHRIVAAQRRPDEFLVRPEHARDKVVSALLARAAKTVPSVKFDLIAARNRWIVDLMANPIPFAVICHLADLAAGGHTAQDLVGFAGTPPMHKIEEYVRGTWR